MWLDSPCVSSTRAVEWIVGDERKHGSQAEALGPGKSDGGSCPSVSEAVRLGMWFVLCECMCGCVKGREKCGWTWNHVTGEGRDCSARTRVI